MAYCRECGAYIADGFDKCPACGLSTAEPKRKRVKDDDWDIYEDNGYKGGAAAYKKQSSNRRERAEEFDASEWRAEPVYDAEIVNDAPDGTTRLLAAASYWSWLFILPLILRKDDPFVRLHLNQGIALTIISTVLSWMGFLGGVANLAVFVMCVIGFINAVRGKECRLPIVSEINIIK